MAVVILDSISCCWHCCNASYHHHFNFDAHVPANTDSMDSDAAPEAVPAQAVPADTGTGAKGRLSLPRPWLALGLEP